MQTNDPWILRAEAEYRSAQREHATLLQPNPAAVCHHAHQCVLRFLQARLREARLEYPSMPHPVVLLECCLDLEPDWEIYRSDFRRLHVNATIAQDPQAALGPEQAEESFLACARFREVVLESL
jgi:hypothetical protein